ncbi:oxidoreductase [Spongiactinospora rosea]|uniref:Oxidoreductase n=1 Tax=Spongiactinospora rosea TaxID=2248750 RepID=A0A366LP06_9ACTN|nr:SDR family NAD(P)-dependent oxidoreductase [Spongiactinospora rosea]RBQ15646.1 oxidoreductase [Spongiactinospora rosea]
MSTYVMTGTDGIARAMALARLRAGDTVVVVGRSAERGKSLLDAGDAVFLRADLSLVAETRRVAGEIAERFPVIDGLVMCAQHGRSTRLETAEGLENTFALYYLSRHILADALAVPLERAARPVVLNVCAPGVDAGEIHWGDLQLRDGYAMMTAILQASRLNDLLGVAHGARPGRTRYVLVNPGGVATSFSGEYDAETVAAIERARAVAQPVDEAVVPILALLTDPPADQVSAYVQGERIAMDGPAFDPAAAGRLRTLTGDLLSRV